MSTWDHFCGTFDCSPWHASTGAQRRQARFGALIETWQRPAAPLYTPAERLRRDATPWTMVQAVLAPAQFAAFAVSLCLVFHYIGTGHGYAAATASILVKTGFLFAIMVTGSFWERAVFGRWLFAPAFFWEDLFSFLVIALHCAYVVALATGGLPATGLMLLALTAYAAYLVNAAQFVVKMRRARLESGGRATPSLASVGQRLLGGDIERPELVHGGLRLGE